VSIALYIALYIALCIARHASSAVAGIVAEAPTHWEDDR
jgi:hypothetical protein